MRAVSLSRSLQATVLSVSDLPGHRSHQVGFQSDSSDQASMVLSKRSTLAIIGVLLSSCVSLTRAAETTDSLPGVVDLTPDNFDAVINGGKHALVEFYAPWCGHCRSLVPALTQLGETVSSTPALNSRVVIAKVDADKHSELGSRFGVTGFPTLKWFSRGKSTSSPDDYSGSRSVEGFTSWIQDKLDADRGFARVGELDTLVKEYLSAGADAASSVTERISEAASKLTGDSKGYGQLYMRVLKKGAEKGQDYFQQETSRLERLMQGGKASSSKMDQIMQKLSVLSAFSKDDTAEE